MHEEYAQNFFVVQFQQRKMRNNYMSYRGLMKYVFVHLNHVIVTFIKKYAIVIH